MSNHRSAEELLGILHKLRDYTSTHFRDEEKRFVHTEYPAVKDHLLIHREFEVKVDEVERGIKQGTVTLSMTYLKMLPLEQLKIDGSFIRDLLTDSNDAAIAATIIALSQSLGFSTVAECVENSAQQNALLRM